MYTDSTWGFNFMGAIISLKRTYHSLYTSLRYYARPDWSIWSKNLCVIVPVSHFRFSPLRTLQEFEKKTCGTFVGKCYTSSTVRENYKLGVNLGMSMSKFPGHKGGPYTKCKAQLFSNCLNFGLESKSFQKFV